MQEDCRVDLLVPDLAKLFIHEETRRCQLVAYEEALEKLGKGRVSPGETGARCILETIERFRVKVPGGIV
jgi:hypothetical protein